MKIVDRELFNDFCKVYDGNRFFMVQDNAPCHKSAKTMAHFEKIGWDVLNLPLNSPDLNLIENIRGILSARVYKHGQRFNNNKKLWERVKDEWARFTHEEIAKCIENYNDRLGEVFQSWGDSVEY